MAHTQDIVDRLRDRAYSGLPDPLLAEAADEIDRLRNGAVSGREAVRSVTEPLPVFASGSGSVTPVSYEKSDEKRVLYDTKSPRNGALSDGPDPDSRVWETPCTPQPHAIPAQGSAQGDGSVRDSRNANEPVAWAVMPRNCDYCVTLSTRREAAQKAAERKVEVGEYATMDDIAVVPLYRSPQPTLTDAEREAVERVSVAYELLPTEGAKQVAATMRGLLDRLGN